MFTIILGRDLTVLKFNSSSSPIDPKYDASVKAQSTSSGVSYTAYDASGTILQRTKIYYSVNGVERLIYTTTANMASGTLTGAVPYTNLKAYFPGYVQVN